MLTKTQTAALPLLLAAGILAGCQANSATRIGGGALLGSAAGAGVGALATGGSAQGALIGAGIGAVVGGAAGAYMDSQEQELRQELQGTDVEVTRLGDTIRLDFPAGVTFDTGSARIEPGFEPTLNEAIGVLNRYPETVLDVFGHTDTVGPRDFNQELSEDRAQSVANYMIGRGISPDRVTWAGFGENRLLVETRDEVNEPRNRRVELYIRPLAG